jgi:hypothetical protein
MSLRAVPERFLVAFSFAGDNRDLIQRLAVALEKRLGDGTVFYDNWYEHYILGPDGDLRLQEIYGKRSEMVVIGVSERYGSKEWPRREFDVVRARAQKLSASNDERDQYRITPLRVGDGNVKGIYDNTIVPEIRRRPIAAIVDLIVNRLLLVRPDLILLQPEIRHVFLAECTPDLDDESRPVNRRAVKNLLEELGWTVLPADEYEVASYDESLQRDLQRSEAYVQLLGPVPWKHGNFDRRQFDAAMASSLTPYVFRSDEIRLDKVESEAHREWLKWPNMYVSGFDDFLVLLRKKLGSPKVAKGRREFETKPLVRVDIRSANRTELWDRLYKWIIEDQEMESDVLRGSDTFASRQSDEPCHGFLIVCDAQAMEEGPLSPREALMQCRQIQIGQKDAARRPPVALVYWPPPEPKWARLLQTTPSKLHRAQAGADDQVPPEVTKFFDDVRRAAG